MKDIADLIGRIFISLLFIYEALDTLLFFNNSKHTMEDYGVSYYPNILLGSIIFLLFLGSILVLIGYYARVGAFFFCWCIGLHIPGSFILFGMIRLLCKAQRFILHAQYRIEWRIIAAHCQWRWQLQCQKIDTRDAASKIAHALNFCPLKRKKYKYSTNKFNLSTVMQ
ncbi:MAG: DoxX family protein [Saprospiraceae bacterium]|nr:DoxX family protein [Saprospiraceae bacterium]